MSDLQYVNLLEETVTMAAGRRMIQAGINLLDSLENEPEKKLMVAGRLGPFLSTMIFLEQQAVHNMASPLFEPTKENVCMFYDYSASVGWCFVVMPLLKEEILINAVEIADVAPWFHEAIKKPALPNQPLFPTVQMQMMLHMEQSVHVAKALLEEVTIRISEIAGVPT